MASSSEKVWNARLQVCCRASRDHACSPQQKLRPAASACAAESTVEK